MPNCAPAAVIAELFIDKPSVGLAYLKGAADVKSIPIVKGSQRYTPRWPLCY